MTKDCVTSYKNIIMFTDLTPGRASNTKVACPSLSVTLSNLMYARRPAIVFGDSGIVEKEATLNPD